MAVYSLNMPGEAKEKVMKWQTVVPKKKPKVVGRIPAAYEEPMGQEDAENLDVQSQTVYNALRGYSKKRPSHEGRGQSPDLRAQMEAETPEDFLWHHGD